MTSDKDGCNEWLCLSATDAVLALHAGFVDAGAMILETDTFGASRIVLAEYGLEDRVETCQDLLQVKLAVVAAFDVFAAVGRAVPVMVSVTVERTGTMLVGTDIAAAEEKGGGGEKAAEGADDRRLPQQALFDAVVSGRKEGLEDSLAILLQRITPRPSTSPSDRALTARTPLWQHARMSSNPTLIFLGDGMADEAVASLGGRTPLQAARTPAMDSIARDGRSGTLFTLPAGFPTSSEVANMSVLGCDLATEYCGRGPLEAAGRGLELGADEIAFRMNLVTVENGTLTDYSGGHIEPADAEALVRDMNAHFGSDTVRFHPGVSYRCLLVVKGPAYSTDVATEKPDDNQGNRLADHLPRARTPAAEPTAALLRRLMEEAPAVLGSRPVNRRRVAAGKSPANGVWPWNGGRGGRMRSLRERYGIRSAVISAVDVIVGLGRALGMDAIPVPGATGYIDTNYEGKADAAIAALATHDFVYLHVEAIDEVSHEQNLDLKIRTIEDFDRRVVARVLDAAGPGLNVAVLPDHPVPIALGKHTRTPVPVAVRMAGVAPDAVRTFDEVACLSGGLGAMKGAGLMDLLFSSRP